MLQNALLRGGVVISWYFLIPLCPDRKKKNNFQKSPIFPTKHANISQEVWAKSSLLHCWEDDNSDKTAMKKKDFSFTQWEIVNELLEAQHIPLYISYIYLLLLRK